MQELAIQHITTRLAHLRRCLTDGVDVRLGIDVGLGMTFNTRRSHDDLHEIRVTAPIE
jgi:hypothetical protein